MAKVSYLTIPTGTEDNYWKALTPGSRFLYSRVRRADSLLSRYRKKGVSQKSLLPQISELWAGLTSEQKSAWSLAGAECNLNGWQLFVQDNCIRIANEIPGIATPSIFHQGMVGKIVVGGSAQEIKIAQYHPNSYYVQKKVAGKYNMYYPFLISEGFGLPLKISLNFKSNLESVGAGSYAKFYAKIWNSYQGKDDEYCLEIPLDFSTDWKKLEATLTTLRGTIIGYNLYFELFNLQGELLFDNIVADHNLTNWARDPFCKNIDITFTKAFFQIPKNWVAVTLPDGAEFDSVYPDD
ncbi:MAG TPA: hypothetical protein PLQ44_03070 [Candidatus Paceibacterota bacterium]|nr:hypothetical protein [Candidatus Paceibacterota bacterium]